MTGYKRKTTYENQLFWLEIEEKYLYGKLHTKADGLVDVHFPTMDLLAREYGITKEQISKHFSSKAIDWRKERENYLSSIAESVGRDRYEKKSIFKGKNLSKIQASKLINIERDLINVSDIGNIVEQQVINLKLKAKEEGLDRHDIDTVDKLMNVIEKKNKLLDKLEDVESKWFKKAGKELRNEFESLVSLDNRPQYLTTEIVKDRTNSNIEEIEKLKKELENLKNED